MSDLKIDTQRVRSVAAGLSRIATEFRGANVHSDNIAEAVGHDALAEAVRSFAHAWDDTRADMTESVTGLSEATTAIADIFEQADAELAAAMESSSTVASSGSQRTGQAVPR
ncbi:MAG: hypothetical protein QM622_07905 [Microbacterium sp.]